VNQYLRNFDTPCSVPQRPASECKPLQTALCSLPRIAEYVSKLVCTDDRAITVVIGVMMLSMGTP
jgi:hypothetical protein